MTYWSDKHCAAVKTHWSATSVPAQTNSYRPFRKYLICATQAQLPGTAGLAFAILRFTSGKSSNNVLLKLNSESILSGISSFVLVSFLVGSGKPTVGSSNKSRPTPMSEVE